MIKNDKKLIIGAITLSLIIILGIVYAVFTSNLSINGTGVNRKSNFDIYFNNVSNFLTTGTAIVTDPNPTARNHTTVIEDYEATLISPTDSIYFTFDIVNDGDYDATLTGLTLGPVKCSVNGNESDTSATNVCSNIEYTIKYTSDNSNVSLNDTLASKETKEVKVTLTYKEISDASKLPTSNVTINNLGIDMVYTADSEAKTNSDGSTPKKYVYNVGDEITVNGEQYYVVAESPKEQDYVTALKSMVLTPDEINDNKIGSDGINHVNRYTKAGVGEPYRYASNLVGGMAYYTSETCGYVNGSWIYSGCTTDYNLSDIKYIVDNWARTKFINNELKSVDGYEARLINSTDYDNIRLYDWRIYGIYSYWTMIRFNRTITTYIVEGNNGYLNHNNDVYQIFPVRPVINVYKSKLS